MALVARLGVDDLNELYGGYRHVATGAEYTDKNSGVARNSYHENSTIDVDDENLCKQAKTEL